MSYSVVVTQTNKSGFSPTVSPDPFASVTEEGGTSNIHIQSAYQGSYYSVDLVFEAEYPDPLTGNVLGTANVTNVTPTTFNFSDYGMTALKVSNNIIRISGTFTNAFPDEFYYFKLRDNSFEYLEPTTNVEFKALIHYNMPTPTTIEESYPFEVQAPTDFGGAAKSNVTHTMKQWIVWRYQPAVAAVQSLIAQGDV